MIPDSVCLTGPDAHAERSITAGRINDRALVMNIVAVLIKNAVQPVWAIPQI
jgi:hypothetical protein